MHSIIEAVISFFEGTHIHSLISKPRRIPVHPGSADRVKQAIVDRALPWEIVHIASLAQEVRILLTEVGKLREEKRGIQ